MRDKAAEIPRDRRGILANAQAAGLVIDDPNSHDGEVAVKFLHRREGLINKTLLAIFAPGGDGRLPLLHQCDVGAFAGKFWFLHVTGRPVVFLEFVQSEIGRQKIGMVRIFLPENRQQPFIGQKHLPHRLDEVRCFQREILGKLFVPHPFPRIQFEIMLNRFFLQIDEPVLSRIETQVFNKKLLYFQAGLETSVLDVEHRLLVLERIFQTAEMNFARSFCAVFFPSRNQMFVDAVELIGLRIEVLQPLPLRHRCFHQRRRGIGVIFQHLRRTRAVVGKIEPAIQTEVIAIP